MQELQNKLHRLDPDVKPITPQKQQQMPAIPNKQIQNHGLSTNELIIQHDQLTGEYVTSQKKSI